MKISGDKITFVIISLVIAIFLWRHVQIEKMTECQIDQNSHDDCQVMLKRLERR